MNFNVVACTPKMSKQGKTYYILGVVLPDGSLCELFSPKSFKVGESVKTKPIKRIIGNSSILALAIDLPAAAEVNI